MWTWQDLSITFHCLPFLLKARVVIAKVSPPQKTTLHLTSGPQSVYFGITDVGVLFFHLSGLELVFHSHWAARKSKLRWTTYHFSATDTCLTSAQWWSMIHPAEFIFCFSKRITNVFLQISCNSLCLKRSEFSLILFKLPLNWRAV